MILELAGLYLAYKGWRWYHDDPACQIGRAHRQVQDMQTSEMFASRANLWERQEARVAELKARTDAANIVEQSVKEVHEASRETGRKMREYGTSCE